MAAFCGRHVFFVRQFLNSSAIISSCSNVYRPLYGISLGARFLYSQQYLGVDRFLEQRERILNQFGNLKEKFCGKVKEILRNESTHQITVFSEDLKNMIFITEDKEEEIDICVRMIHQFNEQSKELRFGQYTFGPVAMRLFHYLDKPDIVLQLLTNDKLEGFFHQAISFHIGMDLLFKHKRYQDVLSVYELVCTKNFPGGKFPKDCVVLALASCYMVNTRESFDHAMKIMKEVLDTGSFVLRRGVTFASFIALKQNEPHTALEVLSASPTVNYITVRNLRLMALAEMDRLDDIFQILRTVVNSNVPTQGKKMNEICKETIEYIQRSVDRVEDKSHARIFEQLVRVLEENDHIRHSNLESLLVQPIAGRMLPQDKEGRTYRANRTGAWSGSSYERRQGRDTWKANSESFIRTRPGLRDMDD